jgi:transposase
VRATTAFNKILAIPGAWVASVTFTPEGVVVGLRRRFQLLTCPRCGWQTRAQHGVRQRRWRHLDLGAARLWLECDIRRLHCWRCDDVVTEAVPWARHAGRFTRDFEDVVAWLAQRVDKTTVTRLLRCSWQAVADIVERVVAEAIDDARLDDVYRIGVDEVSFRKGHRYLTVVADHDRQGAIIWAGEGKSAATLAQFYDELGEDRTARLEAVSLDMGGAYAKATRAHAPEARQCIDPFHVVKLCNDALDATRRWAWNTARAADTAGQAQWVKRTRWALLKDPARLKQSQRAVLEQLRRTGNVLYRAWQIKELLRDLYKLADPALARAHLDAWLAWACRCRIPAIVTLSRTIRAHREGILAAVELGLSNSKLEGLASKIRLINHRGYGHHSAAALIAMLYLCAGGITIELPTKT